MSIARNLRTLRIAVWLMAVAVVSMLTLAGPAQASNGTSGQGIIPSQHPGNFVASDDDQVCYEVAARGGFTNSLDREVRGFKIDPAADFSNQYVDFKVSADGRSLDWSSTNAEVLAVIVKGGPNYHLYKYQGTGLNGDTGLHSPAAKKNVPQISHYNVCYMPDQAGGEGCTPGFWRNDTPANRPAWNTLGGLGYAPTTLFASSGLSYQDALSTSGGGLNALLRHAAAAHLNALHPGVDYLYSAGDVLSMFEAAKNGGDIEGTKNLFEAQNESGCPLSATNG